MKKIFCILFLLFAATAYGATPVLHFSDLTSGPKTGLGDRLGDGAIVTVWGINLGSSQGSSKIYCGGVEADHVYYWENADPATGSSGPSDMFTYHRMQEIAFSVDSTASDGLGTIYVEVGGVASNTLPFTVRTGNIYFVNSDGGNDSADGSWETPWDTWAKVSEPDSPLATGDIYYLFSNMDHTGWDNRIGDSTSFVGTAARPYAWVAYPGENPISTTADDEARDWAIRNVENGSQWSVYCVFSKIAMVTEEGGFGGFPNGRMIGCSVTDIDCADGSSGAIAGRLERYQGLKIFGNYVYDFGCSLTSNQHHTTYFTNRDGVIKAAPEFGWNLLKNNQAENGINIFDENDCGDMSGTFKLHHNYVIDQAGVGFGLSNSSSTGGKDCWTMEVHVYNNVFVNVGIPHDIRQPFYMDGDENKATVYFYNNTIYDYLDDLIEIRSNFAGTYYFKNNIIYDTNDTDYYNESDADPSAVGGNIWYNGGNGYPVSPPSWDSAAEDGNPLFSDAPNGDFNLLVNSPAIDGGVDTSAIVTDDFYGNPRNGTIDSGAIEYGSATPTQSMSGVTISMWVNP